MTLCTVLKKMMRIRNQNDYIIEVGQTTGGLIDLAQG